MGTSSGANFQQQQPLQGMLPPRHGCAQGSGLQNSLPLASSEQVGSPERSSECSFSADAERKRRGEERGGEERKKRRGEERKEKRGEEERRGEERKERIGEERRGEGEGEEEVQRVSARRDSPVRDLGNLNLSGHLVSELVTLEHLQYLQSLTTLKVHYGIGTVREGPYGVDLSNFPQVTLVHPNLEYARIADVIHWLTRCFSLDPEVCTVVIQALWSRSPTQIRWELKRLMRTAMWKGFLQGCRRRGYGCVLLVQGCPKEALFGPTDGYHPGSRSNSGAQHVDQEEDLEVGGTEGVEDVARDEADAVDGGEEDRSLRAEPLGQADDAEGVAVHDEHESPWEVRLYSMFADKTSLQDSIKLWALSIQRTFRVVKSSQEQYTVKCKQADCPWRVCARIPKNETHWIVSKVEPHSCVRSGVLPRHRKLMSKLMAKIEAKKKMKTVVERYWDCEFTNVTQPIWLRKPREASTEEYNEFFKTTFNEYLDPLASSHFTTEGEVEFRSILYVPDTKKEDITDRKINNISLYVKRVFISDDFDGELFPRYLSFVKGVVDSNDLPLNLSREILQESRIVRIMRKRLVRKAFDMILGISCSENRDDYERFWENYGKFLKLGVLEDKENHKRIAPLLRFFSSQSSEEYISLDEYVENMKPEQKAIYYVATDSLSSAKTAPLLEKLNEKEYEVLFLIDPMDEVCITNLNSYKDKQFVDISKEDLDLGDKNEEREKEIKQEYSQTCDWIKKRLGDKVARVDISNRLSSSPCVLVAAKFGWSANMERLTRAQSMGDTSLDFIHSRKVFEIEINPEHEIIKGLNVACRTSPDDPEALNAVDILFETAMISSGFTPDNPAELSGKIYEMMSSAIAGKWASRAQPAQPTWQHQQHAAPGSSEPLEAEVVEPVEAGRQK